MRQALVDYPGVHVGPGTWIVDPEFADDFVLGYTMDNLQPVVSRMNQFAQAMKTFSTETSAMAQSLSINEELVE
ncbi:unnamed protein product [Echinostoma caproni]|uniref:Transcriptional regulator n=1 Tax=Echinostoma caproni TaxID=27848 RepID=A0A183BE03_9TREM|nr:unnamed protein product [Echinostoma caproni]